MKVDLAAFQRRASEDHGGTLHGRPITPHLGEGREHPVLAVAGVAHPFTACLDIGVATGSVIPARADIGVTVEACSHDVETALVARKTLPANEVEQTIAIEIILQAFVADGGHVRS